MIRPPLSQQYAAAGTWDPTKQGGKEDEAYGVAAGEHAGGLDALSGVAWAMTKYCPPNETCVGSNGGDYLYGTRGSDGIYGLRGNDEINARAGNDRLMGAEGADWLYGGNGQDVLDGGRGFDHCVGNAGPNQFISCESK